MAFGLTSKLIAEHAAKPFIRAALAHPFDPHSVLSFHCGFDTRSDGAPAILRDGAFAESAEPFWFGSHPDYDDLCRPFADVVRAAGEGRLGPYDADGDGDGDGDSPPDWDTVDGRMARVILCDQLSRNCFRGTDEAFRYDEVAIGLAREMADEAFRSSSTEGEPDARSRGEMYGSYAYMCVLPFMHSEELGDHETGAELVEWGRSKTPGLDWDRKLDFLSEHTAVIERFGRYPHRNAKKRRESTAEEKAWLEDVDNLPGWAKSQG